MQPRAASGGGIQHARPDLESEYVAPRDETEQEIANIWQELLGLEQVGIYDDFFELGGHSLLATRVVSRIRQSFAVSIPLRSLFDASTVAGQAEVIARARRADTAPPIEAAPRNGRLPLSYAQESLWFLEQLTPGDVSYNMPGAIRIHGALDVDALQQSFAAVVARHEALRTTFAEVDGQPVQSIAPTQPVHVALVDLGPLEAEAREALTEELVGAIRGAVSKQFGIHAWAVVLIEQGNIPKTSSGKIQRRKCRSMWIEGALPVLASSPESPIPHDR